MTDHHWRQLAEGVTDLVVATDSEGTVTYSNGTSRLLGWHHEELVGQPLTTLIPKRFHVLDGLPYHRAMLVRAATPDGCVTNLAHKMGVETEVNIVVTSSGKPESDEEICFFVCRGLHTSMEYTSYPVGTREDATDQEQLYRLVFESAPIGLIHFDSRGVITAVNDVFKEAVGVSTHSLIGLNMQTLPHPQIVECVKEAVAGRPAMYEGEYKALLTGKVTMARVKFSPTFDAEGRVTGGVGIVEDTTEQHKTQRALARVERMASLGTLAAGVTHELNTPLSFTMAGIELARLLVGRLDEGQDKDTLSRLETTLDDACEGIERVRTIVRDLKTFARSADELLGPVDIEAVLDIATKLTRIEVRHRAKVERDFGGVPLVHGSEPRLVQLFVNLIVNAAQSIVEGHIEDNLIRLVTKTAEDGRVLIEIHDTGAGITKDAVDRIFEPFWTSRSGDGGFGLGLSICHGIVMAHSGEISVESDVGQGSIFRVLLPCSDTDEVEDRSQRITQVTTRSASGLSILVVDDEEAMGRTIQLGIGSAHQVTVVTSGDEALKILTSGQHFDVVLCDLMLPDLPGPDLHAEVVMVAPEHDQRFVFMTGGAFTDKAREFLQRVPNQRLEKPFLISELRALLDEWQPPESI